MKRHNITKNEILKEINNNFGISSSFSDNILNGILDIIVDGLIEHQKVKITGFGTFKILNKNSRMARNPKTGDDYLVKAGKTISFYPSKKIKNLLNEKN